jgi:hypothetical protein
MFDTAEGTDCFGAEQAVGVGDDADFHVFHLNFVPGFPQPAR